MNCTAPRLPSSTADLMVNSLRLWSQRLMSSLTQASCEPRYWRQRLMNCTAPGSAPTTPNSEVGGGWAGIWAVTPSWAPGARAGAREGALVEAMEGESPLYGGMEGGGAIEELSPGPRVEYTR